MSKRHRNRNQTQNPVAPQAPAAPAVPAPPADVVSASEPEAATEAAAQEPAAPPADPANTVRGTTPPLDLEPPPGVVGPDGLRTDGPTLEEWVEAGYNAEAYPPQGYADKRPKSAPEPAPIKRNIFGQIIRHDPTKEGIGFGHAQ